MLERQGLDGELSHTHTGMSAPDQPQGQRSSPLSLFHARTQTHTHTDHSWLTPLINAADGEPGNVSRDDCGGQTEMISHFGSEVSILAQRLSGRLGAKRPECEIQPWKSITHRMYPVV